MKHKVRRYLGAIHTLAKAGVMSEQAAAKWFLSCKTEEERGRFKRKAKFAAKAIGVKLVELHW